MLKTYLKNEKAITLIALVITIIVLLILAGVAISAISGNENTMGKAQEAKEKSQAADELESINQAVIKAIPQGRYDLNVDQQSLKEGLEGIVDNPEVVLTNADSWTVTGSVTKKTYRITNEGDVKEEKILTPEEKAALVTTINSKIGNTVQYSVTYAVDNTTNKTIRDWQVFYASEENNEVFIISKDILETNTAIGNTSTTSNAAAYSSGPSSSSLAEGTYGRKYNSIWLGITGAGLNGTTVNNNAKSVAYLCDASTTGHWAKYAGGTFGTGTGATTASTIGNVYAVGGATIELLAKSVTANPNVNQNYANAFTTSNVTNVGYPKDFIQYLPEPYKAKYDGTNYGIWWLASPSSSNGDYVCFVNNNGCGNYWGCNSVNIKLGVRPLVSIPLSSFQTSWINP